MAELFEILRVAALFIAALVAYALVRIRMAALELRVDRLKKELENQAERHEQEVAGLRAVLSGEGE